MPSSIKLSVILTERSVEILRKVWLQEPWQDIMKGITFASPKPSMQMEDLASQVEAYVENLYQQRYGSQWGQIQSQVMKIMNQGGAKTFELADEVSQHFKSGDTVLMEVGAVPDMSQWTQEQRSQWIQSEQKQPQITDEMIAKTRSVLRFDLNDRVLCNFGSRWLSGHVVGTAVPDDGDLLPYLVKTDALAGLPSNSISVPSDEDQVCTQEVCFDPVAQLHLVRSAALVFTEGCKPKLRFALGDKIVCRLRNNPEDGLENWAPGFIRDVWPKVGQKATWDMGGVSGKFPDIVPYKIQLSSAKWVFCHRDDHTLIRREGMQPATRVKGISKRMEEVQEADGSKFRIDHVTERKKRMQLELLSDSE